MLLQYFQHKNSSQSNKLRLASILSFTVNILKEFASYSSIHGLAKLVDDFNYLNRSSVQATLSKRYEKKMLEKHRYHKKFSLLF